MEIVDFRNKTFREIPILDNPAYDVHECLLLCKAEEEQTGLYVLCKIAKNQRDMDAVKQLCLFWDIEVAIEVARLLSERNNGEKQ